MGTKSSLTDTLAMNGFVVTLSGMNEVTKRYCKALVEDMGGIYSQDLHSGVTHLVTSTVLSRKYQVAVSRGIRVKTINWFKSARNSLDDSCPIMLGVSASMTQMSRDQKKSLSDLIEKNGGQYSGTLVMGITNVLICGRGEGAKYQHAVKWTIPCVKPQWLLDSLSKGICLPFNGYFAGDRYLEGLKLAIGGLSEDAQQNFNEWVTDANGEVVGEEFMAANFAANLRSSVRDLEMFSDFTIVCGGMRFKCHRLVLASMSSIFKTMLTNDHFVENKEREVEIVDSTPELVGAMLYFINNGVIPNNIDAIAADLIHLAEKYDLQDLMKACERSLANNVAVENVIDTLITLDLYIPTSEFRQKIIDFIKSNAKEVIKVKDWTKFVQNYPNLVTEIFLSLANQSQGLV